MIVVVLCGFFFFFWFFGMMSGQERLQVLLCLRVSAWEDLETDNVLMFFFFQRLVRLTYTEGLEGFW